MSFSEEFDQRLRRACGVTDDSRTVRYEADFDAPAYTGCDTCNHGGDEGRAYVTVRIEGTIANRRRDYVIKEFDDLGAMMRAMDEVEL